MPIRRFSIGLAIASIFMIGIWLVGSVPQAVAETLNFKQFNRMTKREAFPIPGGEASLWVREGVVILESGELAWTKIFAFDEMTQGAGTFIAYTTWTFQDGSTITQHSKGTYGGGSAKRTGEIIDGTGRFQGIKGTVTTSSKFLQREQGEPGPKALGEGTMVYTLPSK